ncbi:MAG TPA: hypothetical protein P5270_06565 [Victivallales bacterium]|nr:hypothetical protein [Victivallales bacterium]HRR29010.1 hypothetical protein [Victivallales bacterium]
MRTLKFFSISLIFFSFLYSFFFELYSQDRLKCEFCKKVIQPGKSYIRTSDGRIFCSNACYEKSLPICAICHKPLSGKYLKGNDGKLYCSEKCLSAIWPKCYACSQKSSKGAIIDTERGKLFFCPDCFSKPKCFCCNLPLKTTILNDGRHVCEDCMKDAIIDIKTAEKLMNEVRGLIAEKLKLKTEHLIEYELVDQKTLDTLSPKNQTGMELGLFRYIEETETITTNQNGKKISESSKVSKTYKIYMVSHMSKRKFIEVAAHELGHDWMQEYYPRIKELKVKEGWAQYLAYKVNKIYGHDGLNKLIETNKDPIYGDGFRDIKSIAEKSVSPMDSLHKFFMEYNK